MKQLLQVANVTVRFPKRGGGFLTAVDNASFFIQPGQTVGLVGESGSGKTTLGRAIVGLQPVDGGSIIFGENGVDLTALTNHDWLPYRKDVQMIFQDPYGSLNPRWSILQILSEPLEIHFPKLTASDRKERVAELLKTVGLAPEMMTRKPHEFSGGQRQRIGIARAIAVKPKLIVCDEAVSALDVSVQAQIVNLLQDLQDELGVAYLFIGHDLAVVQHISHHVVVMQHGQIVEQASSEALYEQPQHDYTKQLLASVPGVFTTS